MACAAAMAPAIFSLAVSADDIALVWVRLGATQLTRTLGASSAESARVSPSTAPTLYRHRIIARVDTLTTSRAVQGL